MSTPGVDRIPDVVGEITGFRAWYVNTDSILRGPRLQSMVARPDVLWPFNDWLEAVCPKGRDDTPPPHGDEHGCGIHAGKSRRHLMGLYAQYYAADVGGSAFWGASYPVVIGEVGLTGLVIPGSQGWISSRARPLRLYVSHVHWRLVKPLEKNYQVEVSLSNTLRGD